MVLHKIQAICQLKPPMIKKEIQALTGRLATLNRFISRYLDRLRPFFTALKGIAAQGWGLECDEAFYAIKEYIASPMSLSQPMEGEELYFYLVASATTVSVALVRLNSGGKQRPIYFASMVLTDVETRYADFERLTLAPQVAAKKLRPYF